MNTRKDGVRENYKTIDERRKDYDRNQWSGSGEDVDKGIQKKSFYEKLSIERRCHV